MTKTIKRTSLICLIVTSLMMFVMALLPFFANFNSAYAESSSRVFNFDTVAFTLKGQQAQNDNSNALFSVENGLMHMVNRDDWRGGQEDGFFFTYTGANLSNTPIYMSEYNYFKIRYKRINCGNGPMQIYVWYEDAQTKLPIGNFFSALYTGAEYDGKWVDLVLDLTSPVMYVKDLETGIIKEVALTDSGHGYKNPDPQGGVLSKMRFNFFRGVNLQREAYAEYFGFFADKESAMAYDGNALQKLENAENYLRTNDHVSEFALAEYTEEKLLELVSYYIEENENINVQADIFNYRYAYPSTTQEGFVYFDAMLYSGGLNPVYVENVKLRIEKEPEEPVLYKFDNEELINSLHGMAAEKYLYNGVMKVVHYDSHQADGFWLYFDTTEIGEKDPFLLQTYPILQWRIMFKGQGPNQFFWNNYNSFRIFGIGYEEEVWLTVQFDTSKVRDAIKVLNEQTGEVTYQNSPSPTYAVEGYTPPAFRGLSNIFRFNMGRRSDLERWALVDYFGFFPTVNSADEYGFDGRVGVSNVGNVDKSVLYMTGEGVTDRVTPADNTNITFDDGIKATLKDGSTGDVCFTSKTLEKADQVNLSALGYMQMGLKDNYSGDVVFTANTEKGSYDYTLTFDNQSKKTIELDDDIGTLNSFKVKADGVSLTMEYISFFKTDELANAFDYDYESNLSFDVENVDLTSQSASECYTEKEAKNLALALVEKVSGSADENLKAKPNGVKVSIDTVSFVSPTRNDTGKYDFKVVLSVGGDFGLKTVSNSISYDIQKIVNYEDGEDFGSRSSDTYFVFGGDGYAVSEKQIKNSDVKTVEFTLYTDKHQTAYIVGNNEFSIETVSVTDPDNGTVTDELVVKVNGQVKYTSDWAELFGDGSKKQKVVVSIVFGSEESIVYINGAEFGTFQGVSFSESSSNVYVAGNPDSDIANYKGYVREVRIFNDQRTAKEIKRYVYEILHFNDEGMLNGSVDGLINYWRLKESNDGFVNRADYSNSLIFQSETFYNGYYHEFVGEDYLESLNTANVTLKTVETWVMENIDDVDNSIVMRNGAFVLGINELGKAYVTDGETSVVATGDYNLKDCNYHHIAFTFEGATVRFYLDGELLDTQTATVNTALSSKYRLGGGERIDLANTRDVIENALIGRIANFKVFSTVRTIDQIKTDMTELNKQTSADGLAFNLPLDQSEKLTFTETVSGNNATIYTVNRYKIINEKTSNYVTFIGIPDPQDYVVASTDRNNGVWASYDAWRFNNMNLTINNWVVDNKEKENIGVMMTFGDLTQNATPLEFDIFEEHMDILDGIIPYTLVLGNHDYQSMLGFGSSTRGKDPFDSAFPYEEFIKHDYYGGSFEEGTVDNTYYKFEFDGVKYLILCLEFYPRDEVLEWSDYIIKKYSDYKVIVTTHNYLGADGKLSGGICDYDLSKIPGASANNGVEMWNKLVRDNPNVIQSINGHVGECRYLNLKNAYGDTVMNASFDSWMASINEDYRVDGIIYLCRYYEDGTMGLYMYDTVEECYLAPNYCWEEDMSAPRGND